MGYDFGKGKRTNFGIGAFLVGVYDDKKDEFLTVSKIGTGLTDEEWKNLRIRIDKDLESKEKPVIYQVDKNIACDVWIKPSIVIEVRADEISRSPVHTAGRVMKKSENGTLSLEVAGYALRFPRLERFRDDKRPEDATTLSEIETIYKNQGKK
jgi:DNA ligase-1